MGGSMWPTYLYMSTGRHPIFLIKKAEEGGRRSRRKKRKILEACFGCCQQRHVYEEEIGPEDMLISLLTKLDWSLEGCQSSEKSKKMKMIGKWRNKQGRG
jgi:hypothetical protein